MKDHDGDRHDALSEAATIIAQDLRRAPLAPVWIEAMAACFDIVILTTAFWFVQYAALPPDSFRPVAAAGIGLAGAGVAVAMLAIFRSYAPTSMRWPARSMWRAVPALFLPVAVGIGLAPDGVAFAIASVVAFGAVLVPTRLAAAAATLWIIEAGLIQRRAVIAGGGEQAKHLIRGLAARKGSDIKLCGIFDDRDDLRSPIQVLGVPKIGSYGELISFVRASEIDMVIISLPLEAEGRIRWLLDAFKVLPVEVRLSAFSSDYVFADPSRDPLIAAMARSFAPERRLTKRVFDLVVGAVATVLLLPVMLAAAVAIKIDSPGPVLFRQRRHGYNDRVVEVLKFRSMYHAECDAAARRIVTRDDPRVTRVGRFLRRSSIDELPQLFDVLRGRLSLVGPRPHAVDALSSGRQRFAQIVDGYSARHRLPPGITGWAQINGWRGEIDDPAKLRARVEHDLFYIENWSLWLDIKILLRTPVSLLDTRSAY